MKRFVFIMCASLLAAGSSYAQNKPAKGSWSTEVQINPFDQDGETFTLDGLKVRYFLTSKDALRLKIGFSTTSSKYSDADSNEENGTAYDYQSKYKKGNINIDLGYERHFNLGKRLDAYLGASVGIGKDFASATMDNFTKYENHSGNSSQVIEITYTGKLKNGVYTNSETGNNVFDGTERAWWSINGAVFAGLDFYIYKGLYIGTELGISGQSRKSLKMEFDGTKTTKTIGSHIDTKEEVVNEETTDNYRETKFKTYIEPRLRIGITF